MVSSHAVREMRIALLELTIKAITTTGELLDIERVTSSSGRGRWKRTEFQYLDGGLLYAAHSSGRGGWKSACKGNSLAAYPTSSTVF